MEKEELFSVIITTYNDSKKVDEFMASIIKQSVIPGSLFIVDGGSKDDTVTLFKKYQKSMPFDIRIIDNRGRLNIPQGYNIGVSECPSKKMFFMGIGNTYSTNFFESLLKEMSESKSEIIYCPIIGNNQNSFSKIFNIAFVGAEKGKDFGIASNRGVLVKRKVFEEIGLFYENFIYAGEDTEFFLRAKEKNIKESYAKDTFLIWDTPINFNEYLKKIKYNSIADIQCLDSKILIKNILSRILFIFLFIITCFTPYFFLLPLLLIGLIILKIKRLSISAIALRFHFFFLPAYYYIKYIKYFKNYFKVSLNSPPEIFSIKSK